jgi:hypothetical protein
MAPKRKNPFCNTREQDYGLKIVGRNATTAAVERVACRFCTVYGGELHVAVNGVQPLS